MVPTLAELKHLHTVPTLAELKHLYTVLHAAVDPAVRARAPRGLGQGALVVDVWRGPRGACAGTTGSWAWHTSR